MCGGFASANPESRSLSLLSAVAQWLQRELQQRQESNAVAAEATGAHVRAMKRSGLFSSGFQPGMSAQRFSRI